MLHSQGYSDDGLRRTEAWYSPSTGVQGTAPKHYLGQVKAGRTTGARLASDTFQGKGQLVNSLEHLEHLFARVVGYNLSRTADCIPAEREEAQAAGRIPPFSLVPGVRLSIRL